MDLRAKADCEMWNMIKPKGPSCTYMRRCAYQGVSNVSFSKNFAYVLNG